MGLIDCEKWYNAYNINGFKFCILECDLWLKTQNNGVVGTFGQRVMQVVVIIKWGLDVCHIMVDW